MADALTTDSVAALTTDSVAALTTDSVAALTTDSVAALTTDSVAALTMGVILPGETAEVWTTFDRVAGNIMSNVDIVTVDNRVFTSDGQGHVTIPADIEFQCGYYAERSR